MILTDLRSDTVTRPTPEMLQAMFAAPVGDDVFGEDPTVNALEEKAAAMFGLEAGLFCPSGTMTNQIAIKAHTEPLSEVICDYTAHIYQYEGGGIAANSGASVYLLHGKRGKLTPELILSGIRPNNIHYPLSKLVALENTSNKGGGSYYTLPEIMAITETCRQNNLVLHLDGARVFNALVAAQESPLPYGECFDSISVCLSKGLGTPVGSILLGSKPFIQKARRIRKVFGGGMRQAGYLAAAGIYALDNHINRLAEDHTRAHILAETLQTCSFVQEIQPVDTNIVIFRSIDAITVEQFLRELAANDILALDFGPQTIRLVTHLDFTDAMLEHTVKVLKNLNF